jgi:hypothetical protein
MLLLVVVFVASCCSGDIIEDNFDEFPSAFKDGYIAMSAVPNKAMTDTIISIKMIAFPLVSGKGKMRLNGTTHWANGWWSMVSPYDLPKIYDTSFASQPIPYDTSFVANEEFVMEWKVKLSLASLHTFRGSIVIDSIFTADSGRYIPIYSFKDRDGARYQQALMCRGSCLQLQP